MVCSYTNHHENNILILSPSRPAMCDSCMKLALPTQNYWHRTLQIALTFSCRFSPILLYTLSMSTVKILIHGKPYEISCDDGQEMHLRALAEQISSRVGDFATRFREAGNSTIPMDYLMLLSALSLADELHDTRARHNEIAAATPKIETVMSETLDAISQRLEKINEGL